MIARNEDSPVGRLRFDAMSELRRRGRQPDPSQGGNVSDLAQCDEHVDIREGCKSRLKVIATGRNFSWFGLVGRWQALDRIEDHRAPKTKPVPRFASIVPFGQTEL